MISFFLLFLNSAKMRVHDCPYKIVNSDHMQIPFEAKIVRSFYDCCFVEGSLARTSMSLRDFSFL